VSLQRALFRSLRSGPKQRPLSGCKFGFQTVSPNSWGTRPRTQFGLVKAASISAPFLLPKSVLEVVFLPVSPVSDGRRNVMLRCVFLQVSLVAIEGRQLNAVGGHAPERSFEAWKCFLFLRHFWGPNGF